MATIAPEVLPFEPEISLFNEKQDATFWIGKVASGNVVVKPELYNPLLKFRGQVYVHELGFVGSENLDQTGRETDEDDKRSVLFAAVQNGEEITTDDANSQPKIIGSARLIIKESEGEPLPIEKYFSDIFHSKPIEPCISAEASRYITRHPNKKIQRAISFLILKALVNYSVKNNIDNVYAMMEEPLIKGLGFGGLPMEVVGDKKQVDNLNGELFPVLFRPKKITEELSWGQSSQAKRLRRFLFSEHGDRLTDQFLSEKFLGVK